MLQFELLKKIIKILDKVNIPYMLTGSIVSSIQGAPRSTHDIDIIIAVRNISINDLCKELLSHSFYIDESLVESAISNKSMFNIIDTSSGYKVDFWILNDDAFDKSRFSRRIYFEFMTNSFYISTPEDTILAKLAWAKLSEGSRKQIIDAKNIYEVWCDNLDMHYINHWISVLEIKEYWEDLLREIESK